MTDNEAGVRLLAFYLPQFHPIPENDAWWGKGFTEWANVARARSLFKGHEQPHLPADLGFYDLRLPETRQAQAELARAHGIHGFCYYHYWFNGRQLLQRPFAEVLQSGEPDFPFCLCWANESWSRRWDGQGQDILLHQYYSGDDDLAHIRALIPAFRDPRYITVEGRPLLLIYRASSLPQPAATAECWRREVVAAGMPGLFLCNVESFSTEHGLVAEAGLDAAVEFAPDWTCLDPPGPRKAPPRWLAGLLGRVGLSNGAESNLIYTYESLADNMMSKPQPNYLRFPCVTPMWDNTARRNRGGVVFTDSTPQKYRIWLEHALKAARDLPPGKQVVFVNAWNEWAEGNHLEPCQRWGRAYLEATREAVGQLPDGGRDV